MSSFDEAQWLTDQEQQHRARPVYLVGLSGPPRSGKDSVGLALAKLIAQRHPISVYRASLSMPMRKTIYALLGKEYTLEHYETTKDIPLPELDGRTIRQAMIALSEEHVKPLYGNGYWGRSLLNTLPDDVRVVVVTDMGFDAEVEVFEERFGIENCVWPQITRPHCDFSGDSRGYVGRHTQRTAIVNEGDDLAQVETCAARIYGRLLNLFGWHLG